MGTYSRVQMYLFWLGLLLMVPGITVAKSRLINGKVVPAGEYEQVVQINSNGSLCTATVIGPRVIATAAHCANTGATANFSIKGTSYSAKMTRSSLYPGEDHDLSLGVTSKDITGVEPVTISGQAIPGLEITLLGFGCTQPGGGPTDGKLRIGTTIITRFTKYDMVSTKAGGAALCFGDSGGPAFIFENSKPRLLGVNSKGNIQDTNYNTRTDISQSKSFLQDFASQQGVEICGVNKDCDSTQPDKPTCTMSASPTSIPLGDSITISMQTQGQVSSAKIDGTPVSHPNGSSTFVPPAAGTQVSWGEVQGPGGTNSCQVNYVVQGGPPPTKPTCTLTASPSQLELGQTVTVGIQTQGTVTSATINGQTVNFPIGSIAITPVVEGNHSAYGRVSGPEGSGSCKADYKVGGGGPDPGVPLLTVVPAWCGYNLDGSSQVWKVCLSVLKKDPETVRMRIADALLITYRDTTQEVLPIIHRKENPNTEDRVEKEQEITLYANNVIKEGDYLKLDHRKALMKLDGTRPTFLEGTTATNQYFVIENFTEK